MLVVGRYVKVHHPPERYLNPGGLIDRQQNTATENDCPGHFGLASGLGITGWL